MAAYAKALEVVSEQLAHNEGLGSIDVLNPHNGGAIEDEEAKTVDVIKTFIGELVLNKKSAIAAATKAAINIFSINDGQRGAGVAVPAQRVCAGWQQQDR